MTRRDNTVSIYANRVNRYPARGDDQRQRLTPARIVDDERARRWLNHRMLVRSPSLTRSPASAAMARAFRLTSKSRLVRPLAISSRFRSGAATGRRQRGSRDRHRFGRRLARATTADHAVRDPGGDRKRRCPGPGELPGGQSRRRSLRRHRVDQDRSFVRSDRCGGFTNGRVDCAWRLSGMPLGIGGLGSAVALTLFALTGFENATAPVDKVRDPSRTIPLALVGGTRSSFSSMSFRVPPLCCCSASPRSRPLRRRSPI